MIDQKIEKFRTMQGAELKRAIIQFCSRNKAHAD